MSKVNNSFHNLCIVHDVFVGRVNEVIFRYLIKNRENIFTVDDCGNITHIADKAILPQTVNATEGQKLQGRPRGIFYDAVQLDLEDYLTGADVRELRKLLCRPRMNTNPQVRL